MERSTRQRTAIRTAIQAAGRPLLPAEILDEAQREVPSMGMATVYRNVKLLVDAGEVQPVELPGQAPRYEIAGQRHHHHFSCNACGRVFDIHSCPGDMRGIAPPGFVVESHDLTLYGQCRDCQTAGAE